MVNNSSQRLSLGSHPITNIYLDAKHKHNLSSINLLNINHACVMNGIGGATLSIGLYGTVYDYLDPTKVNFEPPDNHLMMVFIIPSIHLLIGYGLTTSTNPPFVG